jgi:RNA polymerase sigma factor (sigma-70 family)
MATAILSDFFHRLTRGMAAETLADHSDQQLVERALAGTDEAPFQAIVHRHGPMVYRVCWRVLQHSQDAEDAFQATFLILAQKLRTVRKHASLASWLHGVAHRVALKAKAQTAARRRHEHQASLPDTVPPDDVTWGELRSALDTELSQLPDQWRLPLILCYLEGRTQDEAASQLGWSKITLRRRLEEARTALGGRLSGRGIVWPAALSAVLLSDCIVSAAPAPTLIASTVEAAVGVAAGKTVATAASAKVAVLTEGVMKAMLITKLKTITTVVLVATLIAFGGGVLIQQMAAGQPINARQEGANPASQKADARNPARDNEEPKKEDDATKQERNKLLGTWLLVSVKSGSGYGTTSKEELEKGLRAKMAELANAEGRKTPNIDAVGSYVVYDVAGRWKQYTEGDPAFSFLNYSGTSEIDPLKEHKTIDYVVTTGNAQAEKAGQNEKGQTKRAIYEFVGNETLRVCFGAPGKERPTDLSKPDQGQLLWVLQRVKKEEPKSDPDKKQPGIIFQNSKITFPQGIIFQNSKITFPQAPLHYYPDGKQRELKKQLQDFENELRKKWEKEPDATKAKLLQSGLEHYRERVKAMEEELKKLEKGAKEKRKKLPQPLELKGKLFFTAGEQTEAQGPEKKQKELLKERLDVLKDLVKVTETEYRGAGKTTYAELARANALLTAAELELCTTDKERVVVLEAAVAMARDHEKVLEQVYKAGQATQAAVLSAKANRLETEIALERAKGKLSAKPK